MYTVVESASSQRGFDVCVVITNGPGIVPQMDTPVMVFATNDSVGGNSMRYCCTLVAITVTVSPHRHRLSWSRFHSVNLHIDL